MYINVHKSHHKEFRRDWKIYQGHHCFQKYHAGDHGASEAFLLRLVAGVLLIDREENGEGLDVLQNDSYRSHVVQSRDEECEEQNDEEEERSGGTIDVVGKRVEKLICAKELVAHMECLAEKGEYFGGTSFRRTPHSVLYTCRIR